MRARMGFAGRGIGRGFGSLRSYNLDTTINGQITDRNKFHPRFLREKDNEDQDESTVHGTDTVGPTPADDDFETDTPRKQEEFLTLP